MSKLVTLHQFTHTLHTTIIMTQEQINRLLEFKKLLDSGLISPDDFQREKEKIIGHNTTPNKDENPTPEQPTEGTKVTTTVEENPVEPIILRINEDNTTQPSNSVSRQSIMEKYKLPIIIAGSVLLIILVFLIVRSNRNDFNENNNYSSYESEYSDKNFEDKFERLWYIGSTRKYTRQDLAGWSKADLRILRNYYFAKNNYKFGSQELNNHFSKYSWFHPLYDAQDNWFTQLQIDNVQFIKQLEK